MNKRITKKIIKQKTKYNPKAARNCKFEITFGEQTEEAWQEILKKHWTSKIMKKR